jgi:hypothetical protein
VTGYSELYMQLAEWKMNINFDVNHKISADLKLKMRVTHTLYIIHNGTDKLYTKELPQHTKQSSSGLCNRYACSLRASTQTIQSLSELFKI